MSGDFTAGRPSELEDTAGDVLVRAARHGIATPTLATCTDLLRGVEGQRAP
jgi:ketopantoate reductase